MNAKEILHSMQLKKKTEIHQGIPKGIPMHFSLDFEFYNTNVNGSLLGS